MRTPPNRPARPRAGLPAVAILAAVLSLLSGGCYLLETYRPVGDDSSPADTRDAADPSADTTDADTDAGGCTGSDHVFCLRRSDTTASIDGYCGAAEFGSDRFLRFERTTLDGGASCRLHWSDEQNAKIHLCCEIRDSLREATAEPGDGPEAIWGGKQNFPGDDRLEFSRRSDTTRRMEGALKTFVNARTNPSPAIAVKRLGDASTVPAYRGTAAARTLSDGSGYVIEWKGHLGFSPTPGARTICNFAYLDVDDGDRSGIAVLYDRDRTDQVPVNRPADWRYCVYE